MQKDHPNSKNPSENPRVQAQAVQNLLENVETLGGHVHPQSRKFILAAIESLQSREQRESVALPKTSNVRVLAINATDTEIRDARQRQAVKIGEDVYLPYISSDKLGLPNAFLRSALFPIGPQDSDECVFNKRIPAMGDVSIELTGHSLLDYDRQVLAVLLQAASELPLKSSEDSPWQTISMHQLSRALQISPGANVYKAIESSLQRLKEVRLKVRVSGINVTIAGLIDANLAGEKSKRLVQFRIPSQFAELFGANSWTRMSSSFLQNAKGYVGWVAAFYSTHAKPYPLAMENLFKLSGSRGSLPEFRRKFKDALTSLCAESVPFEFQVVDYTLVKDSLTVYLERWNELRGLSPEEKQLGLTRN